MITLTDDEATQIKSILIALRGIKVREIDKSLMLLSKGDRRSESQNTTDDTLPPAIE